MVLSHFIFVCFDIILFSMRFSTLIKKITDGFLKLRCSFDFEFLQTMNALLLLLLLFVAVECAVVTRFLIEYGFFDGKAAAREDESDLEVFPSNVRLVPTMDMFDRRQLPLTVPSAGLPSVIQGGLPTANLRVRFGADEVKSRKKKKKKGFQRIPSLNLPRSLLANT
jgi:hypothetical protein